MEFKSGFIAIMGSPNVGKSTLLNELVGAKVAITSAKAQTTRNKVTGILTHRDYQMIFLDTPGLHTPHTRLGEYMVKTAYEAQRDVEATLMLVDAKIGILDRDREIIAKLKSPTLLAAVNKTDIVSKERVDALRGTLSELGIAQENILRISALTGDGLGTLINRLKAFLLPGPKYYPEDMITDRPERFIAAELIREKALMYLREEVPHGVGVEIEKVEELGTITNVAAVIYCERDSHKGIIIGKRGAMLKKIASDARADLEMLFGTKVFLEVFVKVKEDWRNSSHMLGMLGYRD